MRVEGQFVYYQFPKAQLRILDALFQNLEDGSALNLNLNQGELHIKSDVSVNWSDLNLQTLLQVFGSNSIWFFVKMINIPGQYYYVTRHGDCPL